MGFTPGVLGAASLGCWGFFPGAVRAVVPRVMIKGVLGGAEPRSSPAIVTGMPPGRHHVAGCLPMDGHWCPGCGPSSPSEGTPWLAPEGGRARVGASGLRGCARSQQGPPCQPTPGWAAGDPTDPGVPSQLSTAALGPSMGSPPTSVSRGHGGLGAAAMPAGCRGPDSWGTGGPQPTEPPVLPGYRLHDPSRGRAPAYSFGVRTGGRQEDRSPGPVYLLPPGTTAKGKDGTPAFSIYSRPRDLPPIRTPGPGEGRGREPQGGRQGWGPPQPCPWPSCPAPPQVATPRRGLAGWLSPPHPPAPSAPAPGRASSTRRQVGETGAGLGPPLSPWGQPPIIPRLSSPIIPRLSPPIIPRLSSLIIPRLSSPSPPQPSG